MHSDPFVEAVLYLPETSRPYPYRNTQVRFPRNHRFLLQDIYPYMHNYGSGSRLLSGTPKKKAFAKKFRYFPDSSLFSPPAARSLAAFSTHQKRPTAMRS